MCFVSWIAITVDFFFLSTNENRKLKDEMKIKQQQKLRDFLYSKKEKSNWL